LLSLSMLVGSVPACNGGDKADSPPTSETKAVDTKSKADGAKTPPSTGLEATIEPPPQADLPTFPGAFDPLLNLVPKGDRTFVAIRDPKRAIAALRLLTAVQGDGLVTLLQGFGLDETQAKLAADTLIGITGVLDGTPIQLDEGIVVLPEQGSGALVYASTEPDALPKAVGAALKTETKCGPLEAGFVVCGEGDTAPSFAPAKAAEKRKKEVASGLVGLSLDRALIAGRVKLPTGEVVSMSVEPYAGQAVFNFTLPPQVAGARQLGPRDPALLGLFDVGSAFAWGNVGEQGLARMTKRVPPLAAGAMASLSGEFVFGTAGATPGFLAALGVKDPGPLRSTLALLQGQVNDLPETLPDGTKVMVESRELKLESGPLATIYGSVEQNEALQPLRNAGMRPDAYLFVADRFAGAHLGGTEDAIKALATDTDVGPPKELLDSLPEAAVADLAATKVSFLAHLPLDGISTDAFREQIDAVVTSVGKGSAVDAKVLLDGLVRALAPLSSITIWVRHEGPSMTLRIAVQPFGSMATEEGKEASAAVSEFLAGKSAQDVFGALASAHGESKRFSSYEIRAGKQPVKANNSIFMVLVIAGALAWGMLMPSEPAPPPPVPSEPPQAPPAPKKTPAEGKTPDK
jgi:hypothetical protein